MRSSMTDYDSHLKLTSQDHSDIELLEPFHSNKKLKMKQEEESEFDWQKFLSDDMYIPESKPQQNSLKEDWYHTNADLSDLFEDESKENEQIQDIICKLDCKQETPSLKSERNTLEIPLSLNNCDQPDTKLSYLKEEDEDIVPQISRGSSPSIFSTPSLPPSRANSPTVLSKKRKIKEEQPPPEEEDAELKKEKNRVAAQRYRQKLREEAQRVNDQVSFFETQNEMIRNQIEAFRRQIEQDRKVILHLQLIMSIQNQNALSLENKTQN